jgi:hypothetical protein
MQFWPQFLAKARSPKSLFMFGSRFYSVFLCLLVVWPSMVVEAMLKEAQISGAGETKPPTPNQ